MNLRAQAARGDVMRDLALMAMFVGLFGVVLLCVLTSGEQDAVNLIMLTVCFIVIALGFFGRVSLAIALAAAQVCAFAGFKLFRFYSLGAAFLWVDFIWLPMPLVFAGIAVLFHRGTSRLETENAMLRQQVEDLVLIEPLTGMYNLRAMCRELPLLAHYCVRHKQLLSLMIIDLRYENELRAILPASRYLEMRQRMAEIVNDTVRIEDRVFAIDDRGTLAVLLTTGDEGSPVVIRRLRTAIEQPDAFEGIMDKTVQVSVRIACKEYDFNFSAHPIEFKKMVESELVYDV